MFGEEGDEFAGVVCLSHDVLDEDGVLAPDKGEGGFEDFGKGLVGIWRVCKGCPFLRRLAMSMGLGMKVTRLDFGMSLETV